MSWSEIPLNELCKPRQWPTVAMKNLTGTGYPVYGANGVIGYHSEFTHADPVLLIGCRGSCGSVTLSEKMSYCNGNAMALDELDTNIVDLRYLYHFLVARGFEDIISGSSQPQITKTNLGRVMVYYPPLTVQRNIAAILDKAHEVKTAIKELPAMLRSLVDSTFLEMFGDPRGCEGPTLANFASVESGNGFPLTFQGEIDNEIPFYKVSDMNLPGNEKYMLSHNNSVSMETVGALKLRIFPPGSVIFPKIGAAIATNKKRITTVNCCVDNNVIGIIPDSSLDSEYLHSLLQFKDLNEFASSSSPPSMRKTDVEGWNIPGHSISEQKIFSEMVVKFNQLSDTSPIAEFLQKSIAQELFT